MLSSGVVVDNTSRFGVGWRPHPRKKHSNIVQARPPAAKMKYPVRQKVPQTNMYVHGRIVIQCLIECPIQFCNPTDPISDPISWSERSNFWSNFLYDRSNFRSYFFPSEPISDPIVPRPIQFAIQFSDSTDPTLRSNFSTHFFFGNLPFQCKMKRFLRTNWITKLDHMIPACQKCVGNGIKSDAGFTSQMGAGVGPESKIGSRLSRKLVRNGDRI